MKVTPYSHGERGNEGTHHSSNTMPRIAIIGAGPISLEAALAARQLGHEVAVYERSRVAEHFLRFGHVRLFSPFGMNRSANGLAAIREHNPDWRPPADDALLTAAEFAETYLVPLSQIASAR